MNAEFWLWRMPIAQRPVEWGPDVDLKQIICPANEGHSRGGKRITDLSVILRPSSIRDVIWTWYSDVLISQRALDCFRRHHVTGFMVKEVHVIFPKAIKAPPKLFELVVTGWGGTGRCAGVRLIKSCHACGHKVYSIAEPSRLVDPKEWDGSDLFIVWPLPRFVFASDRLAHVISEEKISGIDVIPASDIPMQKGASASPGALTRWMPEERARELMQQFGTF
jgi:hypothetical protein